MILSICRCFAEGPPCYRSVCPQPAAPQNLNLSMGFAVCLIELWGQSVLLWNWRLRVVWWGWEGGSSWWARGPFLASTLETLFEAPRLPITVFSNLCRFWGPISLFCRSTATIFTVLSWAGSLRWVERGDWTIFWGFFTSCANGFALSGGWGSIGVIFRGLRLTLIRLFWGSCDRVSVICLFCGLLIITAILWNLDYRRGTYQVFLCLWERLCFGSASCSDSKAYRTYRSHFVPPFLASFTGSLILFHSNFPASIAASKRSSIVGMQRAVISCWRFESPLFLTSLTGTVPQLFAQTHSNLLIYWVGAQKLF